jgi:2-polyprenyl-6-methoxyphenol hydroxylase-like FAD-dependent oxidoreductase
VESARAAYDTERRPRTQQIARRSRRTGAMAQWSSAPAGALHGAVMRITPKSSLLRSLAPMLSWTRPRELSAPTGARRGGHRLAGGVA